MADESVELEIELKDGISKPAKSASRALQKLAEDAERTQTRMMRKIMQSSVASNKRRLNVEFAAAKKSAVVAKRAAQIREAEGTSWSKLGGSISTVAGGIGLAAGALAAFGVVSGAVVYGAAHLGGELIEAAKSAGSLRFALGQLTHTDGAAELEGITKLAAELGLNIESTAHSYERLLKMQFKPDDAKTWVKFGADMQALGNSAEEVEGILLAVSQIKSKGKLQAQEMLQLAERGVSSDLVYDALEKKTGKSRSQVMKLQEGGKIDSDSALAAIQEALMVKLHTSRAGEAAESYVQTFAGSMGKGDAEMQRVGLGLGAAFERGFSDATGRADDLKKRGFTGIFAQAGSGDFFAQMANSPTLEKIGGFVERLGNAFAVLMPHLLAVGDAFVSGFTDGAGLEDALSEDTVTGFAAILRDDIVPAAKTVGWAIGWVSTKVLQLTGGLVYLGARWTNMWTSISTGAESLVTSFTDLGSRVIDGFISGITSGYQRTKDAVTGWADGAVNFAKETFGIHSPSKEFATLGKYSVQGFQRGLDSMTPELPSASSMAPAALMGGGMSITMPITINVNGSDSPAETARMVRLEFESLLAGSFGRFAEGIA